MERGVIKTEENPCYGEGNENGEPELGGASVSEQFLLHFLGMAVDGI